MDKTYDVHGSNGVWIRWIISVILGLGSVGTALFCLGQWTLGVNSEIIALKTFDTNMTQRMSAAEKTLNDGMTMRIILQQDVKYIKDGLDDNARKLDEVMKAINSHINNTHPSASFNDNEYNQELSLPKIN
jgi:hypothetical protein